MTAPRPDDARLRTLLTRLQRLCEKGERLRKFALERNADVLAAADVLADAAPGKPLTRAFASLSDRQREAVRAAVEGARCAMQREEVLQKWSRLSGVPLNPARSPWK